MMAGLYGKIPSYGDFLHRRLPSSFVEPWNDWLSNALTGSQAALGDGWMEAYLTSPPWRFVIEPGLLGEAAWLGVLASSVDRVRRCYPITVAITLPAGARLALLTGAIDGILEALEKITLQLIDGSWTPDAVMAGIDKLARMAPELAAPDLLLGRGGAERLMIGHACSPLAGLAMRWMSETGIHADETYPLSAWWHAGWSDHAPASLITPGLPAPEIFASFLDGRWSARAWMGEGQAGAPS